MTSPFFHLAERMGILNCPIREHYNYFHTSGFKIVISSAIGCTKT